MADTPLPQGSAQARYEALKPDREPFLVRARRCAALTTPSLFRPEGSNGGDDQEVPWGNLGAYGVNNLSSKIVLSLFPPGIPFFKLKASKQVLRDLQDLPEDQRGDLKAGIAKGLSMVETEVIECVEEDGDRAVQFDIARHMVVGGNHGMQMYPGGKIRGLHLDNYVTMRDPSGSLLEFVVRDMLAWETLPDDVKSMAEMAGYKADRQNGRCAPVGVFTHGCLKSGKWELYQEVCSIEVPGSRRTVDYDAMPYRFFGMVWLGGEQYARSYVEEYEGDLQTCDGTIQIITEGSAAIARFITLVRPGGVTNKRAYAEAANGSVLTGNAEDVTVPTTQKGGDYQIAFKQQEGVEARLSRAFLLNSAVQRSGERVTKAEILYVAKELEDALGGVYSNQVTTWQAPYATMKLQWLQRAGRVTSLPKSAVALTIITGAAALARSGELDVLDQFVQGFEQLFPQAVASILNPRNYATRRAVALGLDTEGLVLSDAQAAQQQQAGQAQQMQQQLMPELVRQGGSLLTQATASQIKSQGEANTAPPSAAQESIAQ